MEETLGELVWGIPNPHGSNEQPGLGIMELKTPHQGEENREGWLVRNFFLE